MTKDELEKEARFRTKGWKEQENCVQSYIAGAKPREKRIAELRDKLTKAKEIIKKFSEFANNEVEYDPEHPQEHTDLWNELCGQAEQFLKEVSE